MDFKDQEYISGVFSHTVLILNLLQIWAKVQVLT